MDGAQAQRLGAVLRAIQQVGVVLRATQSGWLSDALGTAQIQTIHGAYSASMGVVEAASRATTKPVCTLGLWING